MNCKISIVGDIMFEANQVPNFVDNDKCKIDELFWSTRKHFSNSHYILGNLETPIVDNSNEITTEKYSFGSPVGCLEFIKKIGVTCVSTANNHCLDRGIKGIVTTICNLQKYNIDYTGTRISKDEPQYLMKNINGIEVGIISLTYGTNAFANNVYLSRKQKYMINMTQEQELSNKYIRKFYKSEIYILVKLRYLMKKCKIGQLNLPIYERREFCKSRIKEYKRIVKICREKGAEHIISNIHIGGQYNKIPTDYTRKMAKLSKDIGVETVICNHEHVIHPIDIDIKNRTLIAYSLGNFISSSGKTVEPFDKMSDYSLSINVMLEKDDKDKVTVRYSLSVFHTVLINEIITVRSVKSSFEIGDFNEQSKLKSDYSKIMNYVLNTHDVDYEIVDEYKL